MSLMNIVVEIDADKMDEKICLKRNDKEKDIFSTENGEIVFEVKQDRKTGGRKVEVKSCAQRYLAYLETIRGMFEARFDDEMRIQRENYESGFEYADEEEQDGIKVPYDPRLITVAPAKFSLKEIVSMIEGEDGEEPELDLAPDFQRDYVWDSVRKSRLIESILLNIPLPVFYFARDKEGKLQVVDGVQRLTTIYKFFKNDFKLTKLEYLKGECEGRYFKKEGVSDEKKLSPKLVRALRQYQIDCNIIEPSTPENVKLDIFKRLNTGGKELNKQEVRHAFMKREVRIFVKKLVDTEEFLQATNHSVNDKRMLAQELVMRYIGFYCLYRNDFLKVEYSTKMDEFIDDVAVKLNLCKKVPYDDIYYSFTKAMTNAHRMFGGNAFRKLDMDKEGNVLSKKNPINKSLFIAFSVLLSSYAPEQIEERGDISREFAQYLNEDEEFYYSISHNTNYQLRETAIGKVEQFLERLYGKGVDH